MIQTAKDFALRPNRDLQSGAELSHSTVVSLKPGRSLICRLGGAYRAKDSSLIIRKHQDLHIPTLAYLVDVRGSDAVRIRRA